MNRAGKIGAKSPEVHSDPGKDMTDHNYDSKGSDAFWPTWTWAPGTHVMHIIHAS